MRILAVCQHYWPEDFQITPLCEDLVKRGHEVTVLAGLPNYPTGVIPEEYRNGANRDQVRNGVHIVRANEIPRGKGALKLAINYYSFRNAAVKIARSLPAGFDVILAYQLSPILMSEAAVEYKRLHNTPLLVYCCDLWPEAMKLILGNRFGTVLEHYRKVSERIYKAADLLVAQSPAFGEYFELQFGISRSSVRYLPHFASDTQICTDGVAPHEGINFLIAGNIGRAQDLPVVVRAVAQMRHKTGFKVLMVGDGACLKEIKDLVTQLGLTNRFEFFGRRPFSEMPHFYQQADACLLTLDGSSWIGTTLPSRLQGYMAAGKTVFAAINGGAAYVIAQSECGAAVPAGDYCAFANVLDEYLDNPAAFADAGKKGRAYFDKYFTRERHVQEMEHMLAELANSR